jgi:hypothetical protein
MSLFNQEFDEEDLEKAIQMSLGGPDIIDLTDDDPQEQSHTLQETTAWVPFYLNYSRCVSHEANNNTLGLTDLINGDIKKIFLMNYQFDMNWLIKTCPLLRVSHVASSFSANTML